MLDKKVPHVEFHTRIRDESIGGDNPFRWEVKTTDDYFKNKRAILFALPGAFTPTCSTYQLPDFDDLFPQFQSHGIDVIYCLSVNDAFVMHAWAQKLNVKNIHLIPDGNGEFTQKMGMVVRKENLGFGSRSWRYAAIINDGIIEKMFEEEGKCDNCKDDPYHESSPQNILKYLESL